MTLERDRKKLLKWLKSICRENKIPYVEALEWWFTHMRPINNFKIFKNWVEKYHVYK